MSLPFERKWLFRGLIAAAIVAYAVFRDELPSIDIEEVVKDAAESLGSWTYLLVGGLAFLETGAFVGLVAPGEFTVILGGAVAGQGEASLPLMIAITWLCAFLGDSCSFLLGAKLGRSFLLRHGGRVGIDEERMRQVEGYFRRRGGMTILIGRFIGLVRALAPFIAGTSKMRYGAFAPYSVLGTGIWATGLVLAGYFASQNLGAVTHAVSQGLIAFGIAVGVIIAIVVAYRQLRNAESRERIVAAMEKRPYLRPLLALGWRLRPQARFLWARLKPGGRFGLEVTSLLAVLAVAVFVLASYWSVVADDPGPTPGDMSAVDVVDGLQADWLDGVAKAVSRLGSAYVVIPLALLAALALGALRRWAELAVLAVGTAVIVAGPDLIKGWTDRPRPEGGLVGTRGSAFPSGHAAHATFYSWLAVSLAWYRVPALTRRGLVIGVGIAVTALIGLTRVYLGVHWASDVVGGLALGYAGYAAAGVVALVLAHIRDNADSDGRAADSPDRRAAPGGTA